MNSQIRFSKRLQNLRYRVNVEEDQDVVLGDGNESDDSENIDEDLDNVVLGLDGLPVFMDDEDDDNEIVNVEKDNIEIVNNDGTLLPGITVFGQNQKDFEWKSDVPRPNVRTRPENIFRFTTNLTQTSRNITTVLDSFLLFFSFIQEIVDCTNLYINSVKHKFQREKDSKNTDIIEIKALLGILYLLGALRLHNTNIRHVWKYVPIFSLIMSYNRFLFLMRCIRFDDKSTRKERLYSFMNMAAINARAILLANKQEDSSLDLSSCNLKTRFDFLEKLAYDLFEPHKERRSKNANLPKHLKRRFEAETDAVDPSDDPKLPKVNKLDKYARCSDCDYAQAKKTKICCSFCEKKICTDHNIDICCHCIDKFQNTDDEDFDD